jgi:hypothetical protein
MGADECLIVSRLPRLVWPSVIGLVEKFLSGLFCGFACRLGINLQGGCYSLSRIQLLSTLTGELRTGPLFAGGEFRSPLTDAVFGAKRL